MFLFSVQLNNLKPVVIKYTAVLVDKCYLKKIK